MHECAKSVTRIAEPTAHVVMSVIQSRNVCLRMDLESLMSWGNNGLH